MAVDKDTLRRISARYWDRAEHPLLWRIEKNRENWRAYRGEQDFRHKANFQNQETTPDLPIACEQLVGTFERALSDNDDWVEASHPGLGKAFMKPEIARGLLLFYLERLYQPGNQPDTQYGFSTFIGDAVKRGICETEIIVKVVPMYKKVRRYRMKMSEPTEDGDYPAHELLSKKTMVAEDVERMRIALDLVPYRDFFRDPSEANNYVIHRCRRQLSELFGNPEYNQEAVRDLFNRATAAEAEMKKKLDTGEEHQAVDPYEIEVREYWGNVVDDQTGEVLERNVFWCIAGDQVIKDVTPNPFWDGTSPFIHAPILRVPGSHTHKALLDHAVPIWRANNELLNLVLDASERAAWGLGQVRTDIMENPEEIADGIPQGYSAVLRPNTPTGQKFYERVDDGTAPQLPLEMMNRLSQDMNTALAIPDTKLGQLPPRQVKATEIVQAMQASGSLYESFAARLETTILEPMFEKVWKAIVQFADHFIEDELIQVLGPQLALQISQMEVEERWMIVQSMKFKVRGLRGVAQKEKVFNKLMSFMNFLQSNPAILEHFQSIYDLSKLYDDVLEHGGVDPAKYLIDQDVEQAVQQQLEMEGGGGEEVQQLNPELLGMTGGPSLPNMENNPEAVRGMEAAFAQAPANQAAGAEAMSLM